MKTRDQILQAVKDAPFVEGTNDVVTLDSISEGGAQYQIHVMPISERALLVSAHLGIQYQNAEPTKLKMVKKAADAATAEDTAPAPMQCLPPMHLSAQGFQICPVTVDPLVLQAAQTNALRQALALLGASPDFYAIPEVQAAPAPQQTVVTMAPPSNGYTNGAARPAAAAPAAAPRPVAAVAPQGAPLPQPAQPQTSADETIACSQCQKPIQGYMSKGNAAKGKAPKWISAQAQIEMSSNQYQQPLCKECGTARFLANRNAGG